MAYTIIPAAAGGGSEGAVIERVTLGADAQEQSFTVVGNTDQVVGLHCAGETNAGGTVTFELNGNALVNRTILAQGALSMTTSFSAACSAGHVLAVDALAFLRATGTADRGILSHGSLGNAAGTIEVYHGGSWWNDHTTEVTSITIKGSVAALFGAGYAFVTRRWKMTA